MEVLRVPPYPITTTWDVPEADTDYDIYVEDLVDHSYELTTQTSTADAKIEYILPRAKVAFDRDFLFRIQDALTGEILTDSNLTVYRPYIDPATLGTTATEIAEYKQLEIAARKIMDAYINDGFYNHKLVMQQVGQGTDYFPTWHETSRVLRAYENGVLVFNGEDTANTAHTVTHDSTYTYFNTGVDHGLAVGDKVNIVGFVPEEYNGLYTVDVITDSKIFGVALIDGGTITSFGSAQKYWQYTYRPTLDNSAIYRYDTLQGPNLEYNRMEYNPMRPPIASGDLGFYGRSGQGVAFPKGFDYIFVLDVGYKAIPPEIELATKYLIEDLKCGNNDYWKRFITQYSTEQFDVKFAPQFLGGTGNIIVDKILDNYKSATIKPGIF
jgi:hypothetical protein